MYTILEYRTQSQFYLHISKNCQVLRYKSSTSADTKLVYTYSEVWP